MLQEHEKRAEKEDTPLSKAEFTKYMATLRSKLWTSHIKEFNVGDEMRPMSGTQL